MKKTILALAALGMFAGAASAQSSLKLSGSIDLGVAKIGDNTVMQTAGKSARSGIAFSGKEDLGGGMSAEFYLNHRFNPENGTQNPGGNAKSTDQFWRNSFVQLNTGMGSLRLGRYLVPLQELNGNYDAFGTDTVGSVHTGGISGNVRANSAVEYRSPNFGGFTVLAMVADSKNQGDGAAANKRPMGFSAQYKAGPFAVAVATDQRADERKTTGLYGAYNWGSGAVMGQLESGEKTVGSSTKSKRYSISTKIPFGAIDFKAGYAKWKDEDTTKLGLGLDYNLSKRTELYVDMGKLGGDAPSETAKKTMFDVGIHHTF